MLSDRSWHLQVGVNGYYNRILWSDKRYSFTTLVQLELGCCTSCPIRVCVCKNRSPLPPSGSFNENKQDENEEEEGKENWKKGVFTDVQGCPTEQDIQRPSLKPKNKNTKSQLKGLQCLIPPIVSPVQKERSLREQSFLAKGWYLYSCLPAHLRETGKFGQFNDWLNQQQKQKTKTIFYEKSNAVFLWWFFYFARSCVMFGFIMLSVLEVWYPVGLEDPYCWGGVLRLGWRPVLAATWAEARDQTIWKAIIGCILEVAIKIVMNNHFYSFNNTIRLQKKGGVQLEVH